MEKIHQFSRSEWNNSKAKNSWFECSRSLNKPTVWYYIANKYAQFYYDIESFWYDEFDVLKKNPELEKYIKEEILLILSKYGNYEYSGSWFSMNFKKIDPQYIEAIASEIYHFLEKIETKFIHNK